MSGEKVATGVTTTAKSSKQTKMPTPQEMQELYDKITPLQKIVTLQHIYSLYMAATQQTEKKEVSFNIIQLQRMINSNPLVNPDFDFLDISGYLNTSRDKNKEKEKHKEKEREKEKEKGREKDNDKLKEDKKTKGKERVKGKNNANGPSTGNGSSHAGGSPNSSNKGPVSPVQLIQILTESLTLRDERGRNEQVIQQVPNTMLFKLSKFIDLNFVKDRLIKLLNAYKNSTLKEIEELEHKWKVKKTEIQKIEQGKMDDSVLYEEFLKDLKRKRGTSVSMKGEKPSDVKRRGLPNNINVANASVGVSSGASSSTSANTSANSSPSPNADPQSKKLQISRNVNKIMERNIEAAKEVASIASHSSSTTPPKAINVGVSIPEVSEDKNEKEEIFVDAKESVESDESETKLVSGDKEGDSRHDEKVNGLKHDLEEKEESDSKKAKIVAEPQNEIGEEGEESSAERAEKEIINEVQKKVNIEPEEQSEEEPDKKPVEEPVEEPLEEPVEEPLEETVAQPVEESNDATKEVAKEAVEDAAKEEANATKETTEGALNEVLGEVSDGETKAGTTEKTEELQKDGEPADTEEPSTAPVVDGDEGEGKVSVQTRSRTRSMMAEKEEPKLPSATRAESKKFQQLSTKLLAHISSHRIASMFLNPVNANDEPQYYELIKKPVDLKTIIRRIKSGDITTLQEVELEMQIMFTNAIMYNDLSQDNIHEGILDMMQEWSGLLAMLKENL